MPTSTLPNGNPHWDPQARYLQLDERVTNLRGSVTHLEQKVDSGFTALGNQLAAMSAEFRTGQKTQWPVIISLLSLIVVALLGFGGAIGLLSLNPVKERVMEASADVKNLASAINELVQTLPEGFVTRRETEALRTRGAEDRVRTEAAVADLRTGTVSRAEWSERSAAVNASLAEQSRRIDELRADFGAVYGTRDVLQDLKDQIRRLEMQVYPNLPRTPLR